MLQRKRGNLDRDDSKSLEEIFEEIFKEESAYIIKEAGLIALAEDAGAENAAITTKKRALTTLIAERKTDKTLDSVISEEDSSTLLHTACRQGYLWLAKTLVENQADLMAIDDDADCPIITAIKADKHLVVKSLLELGAWDYRLHKTPLYKDYDPFNEAVASKSLQSLEVIIDYLKEKEVGDKKSIIRDFLDNGRPISREMREFLSTQDFIVAYSTPYAGASAGGGSAGASAGGGSAGASAGGGSAGASAGGGSGGGNLLPNPLPDLRNHDLLDGFLKDFGDSFGNHDIDIGDFSFTGIVAPAPATATVGAPNVGAATPDEDPYGGTTDEYSSPSPSRVGSPTGSQGSKPVKPGVGKG